MNECDKANGEHGEGIKELALMSVAKCKTNSSTLKSFSPYAPLIE